MIWLTREDVAREVRAGQRGDWRDVRAGEEIAPGAEIRWGDGYGYPWQYVTAPERT